MVPALRQSSHLVDTVSVRATPTPVANICSNSFAYGLTLQLLSFGKTTIPKHKQEQMLELVDTQERTNDALLQSQLTLEDENRCLSSDFASAKSNHKNALAEIKSRHRQKKS